MSRARALAHAALRRGEPLSWFEQLYAQEGPDAAQIPWADLAPNPNLVEWLNRGRVDGRARSALKVGCGLGDDAEELARRGFQVLAFDVSPSAIRQARARFPGSAVHYQAADLFEASGWDRRFDFVLESYTLQVLPAQLRARAIERIASFVAPGGALLVIARGRSQADEAGSMPWPLTELELGRFRDQGLHQASFEDYRDSEDPPVRRFRVEYRRPRTQDAPNPIGGSTSQPPP